jgi:hypothetical protein
LSLQICLSFFDLIGIFFLMQIVLTLSVSKLTQNSLIYTFLPSYQSFLTDENILKTLVLTIAFFIVKGAASIYIYSEITKVLNSETNIFISHLVNYLFRSRNFTIRNLKSQEISNFL